MGDPVWSGSTYRQGARVRRGRDWAGSGNRYCGNTDGHGEGVLLQDRGIVAEATGESVKVKWDNGNPGVYWAYPDSCELEYVQTHAEWKRSPEYKVLMEERERAAVFMRERAERERERERREQKKKKTTAPRGLAQEVASLKTEVASIRAEAVEREERERTLREEVAALRSALSLVQVTGAVGMMVKRD
ncbi:hypothetical protein KIPB_003597 [Kipferlia bialata]|uniref:Uncharacterized protein n=1 Tax=Kipferlia bialata TaxID=797122 RepID=A0A9K3GHD2_9EUKA|nr:hypothetical protein KIPB_003597 [Kipferlia bialata]|eukprot:g3597.t1